MKVSDGRVGFESEARKIVKLGDKDRHLLDVCIPNRLDSCPDAIFAIVSHSQKGTGFVQDERY